MPVAGRRRTRRRPPRIPQPGPRAMTTTASQRPRRTTPPPTLDRHARTARDAVTRANFDTWLRDTVGLRHEDGRFVVGAQNDFATEWLATRLRPLITRTLARVLGHRDRRRVRGRPPATVHRRPACSPVGARRRGAGAAAQPRRAPPALNPALTFDAFVVGDENRLALRGRAHASLAAPGTMNPLTIFGASGLGKTHLLNAIGHAAYAERPLRHLRAGRALRQRLRPRARRARPSSVPPPLPRRRRAARR